MHGVHFDMVVTLSKQCRVGRASFNAPPPRGAVLFWPIRWAPEPRVDVLHVEVITGSLGCWTTRALVVG